MTRQYKFADGFVIDMSKLTALFDLNKFMVDQTTDVSYFINTDDFETPCVPNVQNENGESTRHHVFLEMHDSPSHGHRGVQATYAQLRMEFYWPKLHKEVHKYTGSCTECQSNKKLTDKNLKV